MIKIYSMNTCPDCIYVEEQIQGDDRYERAKRILDGSDDDFSVWDAFSLLYEVRQEGPWATRVSFVYSVKENAVYYTENNDFEHIKKYAF